MLIAPILLLFPCVSKALDWEEGKVFRVIDNEHFVLFDGQVIEIIGLDAPQLFSPEEGDYCFARPVFRLLKFALEGKTVKLLTDEVKKTESGIHPRHVQIDKKNLTEFLLEQGMAKLRNDDVNTKYNKKYESAAKKARAANLGLWQGCQKENIRSRLKASGYFSPEFRKKYASFLAPISIGMVQKVFSGTVFQLTNGLKIKLLGLESPLPEDKRTGFTCFGTKTKNFLESQILGKTVFLKKDVSQFNQDRELLRYVFLAPEETFINHLMVEQGFARSFWSGPDQRFQKEFEVIQKQIYAAPRGAWRECVKEILQGK